MVAISLWRSLIHSLSAFDSVHSPPPASLSSSAWSSWGSSLFLSRPSVPSLISQCFSVEEGLCSWGIPCFVLLSSLKLSASSSSSLLFAFSASSASVCFMPSSTWINLGMVSSVSSRRPSSAVRNASRFCRAPVSSARAATSTEVSF